MTDEQIKKILQAFDKVKESAQKCMDRLKKALEGGEEK